MIKAKDAANELAKKRRDLDGATATLKQTEDALHLINIQVNQGIVDQMRAARDNAIAIAEAEKQASFLGGTRAFPAEKLGQSTQALKAFNSESLKINWGGKEGEKLIKQAERRLALSKLEGKQKPGSRRPMMLRMQALQMSEQSKGFRIIMLQQRETLRQERIKRRKIMLRRLRLRNLLTSRNR